MQKISTQPYKGSRDFYPEDMRLRNYIFNIWKDVCKSYGYKEYDGPFLEDFDLYAAKSGDELVNNQLYSFKDKGDRNVVIRPEMTPTLARMVSGKYKTINYPARWFSIPNLWRYESPQRGRLREFFQLNVDILGIESPEADFEVISTAIDIMKEVGATEKMFELRLNDRRFMDDFYNDLELSNDQKDKLNKALDKKLKVPKDVFEKMLKEDVKLNDDQSKKLANLLENPLQTLSKYEGDGAESILKILSLAKQNNMDKYIKFSPEIVRGLDYYTGTVFEQYDLNPENTRAMFGGGRYDDLTDLFIDEKIPATGYGMGDVTFMEFLKGWDLIPEFKSNVDYLVVRWPEEPSTDPKKISDYYQNTQKVANTLRDAGYNVVTWTNSNTELSKQLKYADREGIPYVVIIGEEEIEDNKITVKNMVTGEQETKPIEDFI